MSVSPLKKFLVPSVILSGTIFSLLTFPLTVLGSNQVVIQLQEEPVFHGKIRDVAAPYLGLATVLSLGAAISSVAVTGWRNSSRKSAQMEEELSKLQKNLKQTETQLEQLKVSETQLQASGLDFFFENEVSEGQPLIALEMANMPEIKAIANSEQVDKSVAIATDSVKPQPKKRRQKSVSHAQSDSRSATVSMMVSENTHVPTESLDSQSESVPQVEQLHTQLQQMMAQIEMLQTAMQTAPQSVTSEAEYLTNSRSNRERGNRQVPRKSQRQQQKLVAS